MGALASFLDAHIKGLVSLRGSLEALESERAPVPESDLNAVNKGTLMLPAGTVLC
jgi:hypothetical protein